MEHLYAFGVYCIELVQDGFQDYEHFFEIVNHMSNPYLISEILFPLVSFVDSVFAAQLLMCVAFGSWMNAVMKWWLLEERPYWWVRETSFYNHMRRPILRQFAETCETGPGSPSGHASTAASVLLLIFMWISHIMNDRKCYLWWWKYIAYPFFAFALTAVILARMFVATHFLHQCLLGALIGAFLGPALCLTVSDPFIWMPVSKSSNKAVRRMMVLHITYVLTTVSMTFFTYYSLLILFNVQPELTVHKAFRWCQSVNFIHVTTTPLHTFVRCIANLFGLALTATPSLAKYRHYTKNRSLCLALLASGFFFVAIQRAKDYIVGSKPFYYYFFLFLINAIRPCLFLRVVPFIGTWPYNRKLKTQ